MIMKQKLHLFLTFNREMLGPELTFVHLTMGFEDKRKRLMKRHEGGETFVEMMEVILNMYVAQGTDNLCPFLFW